MPRSRAYSRGVPVDPERIANLTLTLGQPRAGERMHKRAGAVVASWSSEQHTIVLPPGASRIVGGRRAPSEIVIDDPSVSSQHFEISFEGGKMRLRDLGSRNGTWIDDINLESVVLPFGKRFVVGRVPVVIETVAEVERPVSESPSFGEMHAASASMRELFALLRRLAPSGIDVLVCGETGTGKELVARALHHESERAAGPLVVLDCSSLPAELVESEIHGHAKGAFTGAHEARAGCFEAAHGGTIFIDEIGELPLEQQAKLLRVLERREVRRLGETRTRPVDVRVVAATHRDLGQMVADETFREDLYFRVASYVVWVPPLRERPADIGELARRFLEELSVPGGPTELSPAALAVLEAHPWPGNVRELRHFMRVCARLGTAPVVEPVHLGVHLGAHLGAKIGAAIGAAAPPGGAPRTGVGSAHAGADSADADAKRPCPLPFEQAKDEMTRRYFEALLAFTGGNVSEAARIAELDRRQVHRWLSRLQLR